MSEDICDAAAKGNLAKVKELLAAGANPNAADNSGITSLEIASLRGHLKVMKVLLAAGANPNTGGVLSSAAMNGHLEILTALLAAGANPNTTAEDGGTALHLAAAMGQLEVVKVLMDAGTNLDTQTDRGNTALLLAADNGRLKVVEVLLDAGANPDTRSTSGDTPLSCAQREGRGDVVRLLKARGAQGAEDVNDTDDDSAGTNDPDESDEEPSEQSLAYDDSPVSNNIRYLIMRILRLVFSLISEVGIVLAACIAALGTFIALTGLFDPGKEPFAVKIAHSYGVGTWRTHLFSHPVLLAMAGFALGAACIGFLTSFGAPYKYMSDMPGAGAVECGECHEVIADSFICPECKCSRPERVLTGLCELANMGVTCLWWIHDITIGLLWLGMGKR